MSEILTNFQQNHENKDRKVVKKTKLCASYFNTITRAF